MLATPAAEDLARLQKCSYRFVVTGTGSMEWIWTAEKNRTNKRDHGLSFETARLVFEDPLAISRADPHPDGNRWQTVGQVGPVVLFVVHTWPESATEEEIGRIISARKATSQERRAYEEEQF